MGLEITTEDIWKCECGMTEEQRVDDVRATLDKAVFRVKPGCSACRRTMQLSSSFITNEDVPRQGAT